jgi:hypothetical protein
MGVEKVTFLRTGAAKNLNFNGENRHFWSHVPIGMWHTYVQTNIVKIEISIGQNTHLLLFVPIEMCIS